jgi:cell division protein FtsN
VSSFRRRATAEADARRLGAELGLPARILEANLGAKGVWYRVVVGEAASTAEASALRAELAKKGIRDAIVVSLAGGERVR